MTEQFENKLIPLNISERRKSAGGHLFLQKTEHSDALIPILPVELCPPGTGGLEHAPLGCPRILDILEVGERICFTKRKLS